MASLQHVCVEAGAIGTPVTLQPGETFVGGQTFAAGGGGGGAEGGVAIEKVFY